MTAMNKKTIDTLDNDVFAAIAHPIRRAILDLLVKGEQSISTLTQSFDLSDSVISQHLNILLASGLVINKKHEQEDIYQLHAESLKEVKRWLQPYEPLFMRKTDMLGQLLHIIDEEEDKNE